MPKKIPISSSLIISLLLISSFSATAQELTFEQRSSIPDWVYGRFNQSDLSNRFIFIAHINPFYQRGDFDGDGTLDIAIWIKSRTSNKIGIAIIPRGSGKVFIDGADHQTVNAEGKVLWSDGDNLDFIDAWSVYEKAPVEQGVTEEPPPTLKGDALLLIKTESASGILYWTGERYAWYQQGD